MKLCMSHYSHKRIPDAKFEADSSFGFGDMTPQNFPQKKGTSHQIRLLPPEKGFNFKKKWILCPESFFSTPPCQFQQFSSRGKIFHFQNFCDVSMRKEQQQPPD